MEEAARKRSPEKERQQPQLQAGSIFLTRPSDKDLQEITLTNDSVLNYPQILTHLMTESEILCSQTPCSAVQPRLAVGCLILPPPPTQSILSHDSRKMGTMT